MGYYSDIAVVMRKARYTELLKSIDAINDNKLKDNVKTLMQSAYVDESPCKKWVAIKWTNQKWYVHEYPYVGFIDAFFDKLDEEEPQNYYRIIRVGEDYDDIEIFGSCSMGIHLKRCIEIGF